MIILFSIFLAQVQATVPFTSVYQKLTLGNVSETTSISSSFVTPLYENLQFRIRDQQFESESIQKQYTLKFSPPKEKSPGNRPIGNPAKSRTPMKIRKNPPKTKSSQNSMLLECL